MQNQQEELDEVVDVFQDAQAISDEINYQQDQINDIINQNTDQITGTLHLLLFLGSLCCNWGYWLGILSIK